MTTLQALIRDNQKHNYQHVRHKSLSKWLLIGHDDVDLHCGIPTRSVQIKCYSEKDLLEITVNGYADNDQVVLSVV